MEKQTAVQLERSPCDPHASSVGDDTAESLPSRRYRELILQLEAEHESARGWQAQVSDLLGVSKSYVSKVLRSDRFNVGKRALEAAQAGLGLAPTYWYEDGPDRLPYKDHAFVGRRTHHEFRQGGPSGPVLPDDARLPPGMREWMTSGEAAGLTRSEALCLASLGHTAHGHGFMPRPLAYSAWLGTLRILPPAPTTS